MFDADDVDADYFTPASSTTLSNIFGHSTKSKDKPQNDSLKYTPPKAQSAAPIPEENKKTECVFACTLFGYEWENNVYSSRGKLGFAVIKSVKGNIHNIVLYDANKTTLSYTTVTPNLTIMIKNEIYLSYYDNMKKYWSLHGTEVDIAKIIELLKQLNVNVKDTAQTEHGPPEPELNKIEHKEVSNLKSTSSTMDKGSDTDSSINRKTKMSILSRMASMGQSMLPQSTQSFDRTSDSSDTNVSDSPPKVRHKPVKSLVKRIHTDKTDSETVIDTRVKVKSTTQADPPVNISSIYSYDDGQLVPATTSQIIRNVDNSYDMSMFLTEQRISNSELRINMNRMTDKVDQVLNKINHLTHTDNAPSHSSNINVEILQKLLSEYESKIKSYEEIIVANKMDKNNVSKPTVTEVNNDVQNQIEAQKNEISELKMILLERNNEITKLDKEIESLRQKLDESVKTRTESEHELHTEIKGLKETLVSKDNELQNITGTQEVKASNFNEVERKLKGIMNDTFRALAGNFENNESYSGETIKTVIATVIKRVTIESLNEQT